MVPSVANAAVAAVSSARRSARGRNQVMDAERKIERWNARWMIVAGRAVCTGCLESQAMKDCESPFFHARVCDVSDEKSKHPWNELHEILDSARG